MSPEEIAWMAGLVDGEGYIVITNKQYHAVNYSLGITNTNEKLLAKILQVAGCGRLDHCQNKLRSHYWSDSWAWKIETANTIAILRQLLPWLIVKRERAELVLAGLRWEPGFGLSPGKKRQIEASFKKVTP